MLVMSSLSTLIILGSLTTLVSCQELCKVNRLSPIVGKNNACAIKYAYRREDPSAWLGWKDPVGSLRNATDDQWESLVNEVCDCNLLKIAKVCPHYLYRAFLDVAWACYPGAKEAITKGFPKTGPAASTDVPAASTDVPAPDGGGRKRRGASGEADNASPEPTEYMQSPEDAIRHHDFGWI